MCIQVTLHTSAAARLDALLHCCLPAIGEARGANHGSPPSRSKFMLATLDANKVQNVCALALTQTVVTLWQFMF